MSSVREIEAAIQKLSVPEQEAIARHLRGRLRDAEYPGGGAAADEGIRFLPRFDPPAPHATQGTKLRQHAKPSR